MNFLKKMSTIFTSQKKQKLFPPIQTGAGTRVFSNACFYDNTGMSRKVKIGRRCWIMGEFLMEEEGQIEIGDDCYIGPGTKIWSFLPLSIGHRVFISHGVNIHDTDSHSLSAKERHLRFLEKIQHGRHLIREEKKCAAITIDDDVWIGFNAILLKGVRVGRGAVIGAGAVITKEVDPYTVVVGNPQRVVANSQE